MLHLIKRGNRWYVKGVNSVGTYIKRRATGCALKEAAWEYLKSIDTETEEPPKEKKTDPTFKEALETYLEYKQAKQKEVTRKLARYEITKYMIEPLAARNPKVTKVSQLRLQHLVDLQNSWLNKKFNTLACHRRNSTAFCKYLTNFGWLPTNYWKQVDWPENDQVATMPLDEDGKTTNWDRIRASVIPFFNGQILLEGKTFLRPSNPLWWNPESFLTLLELMYHTGLRRSDAIQFDPHKIVPSEEGFAYTTQQRKSDKPVTVSLQPWLADKLKALPQLEPTGLPFYNGTCSDPDIYADWYISEPLRKLGKAIGIPGLRCHRFRDSFAVNCFLKGISVEDVSDLLGHQNIIVTQRYYRPWCKGRFTAIERRLARARGEQAA